MSWQLSIQWNDSLQFLQAVMKMCSSAVILSQSVNQLTKSHTAALCIMKVNDTQVYYSPETCALTKSYNRRLEVAHHWWMRKILVGKTTVTNKKARTTSQQSLSQHHLKWFERSCHTNAGRQTSKELK